MKKICLSLVALLLCVSAFAQPITENEVPKAALDAFKKEFPTLPLGGTASWSLDKAVGSDKAFYKASWMVSGGFESRIYNMNGITIYTIRDYTKVADAPAAVVTSMKAAYPSSGISKVSEFISTKYSKKGYIVQYQDWKSKYADASGALSTVNPLNDILNTATADASNFVPGGAATPGSTISVKGTKTTVTK